MEREFLSEKIKKNNKIPFHMPGHKRNIDILKNNFYDKLIPYELDITEIFGFDNLHNPKGVLSNIMDRASKIWNSKKTFIMVNGSTGGILASIYSSVGLDGHLLISRNCHKSVYHSAEIFNLKLSYIFPEYDENGIFLNINPNKLEKILEKEREIKAFLLTSPTYEGNISDIAEISKICHKYGVALIVDEAHGAHFGICQNFSSSACQNGADITIQSLHKTLYALTSTAVLHFNSNIVSEDSVRMALGIFQTSSPSYILMSSIDYCIRMIEDNKELFEVWFKNLLLIDECAKKLKFLKILYRDKDIFEYDKSKIVISCLNTSITAVDLSNILRDKYNIEIEMTSADYIIAMTGIGDTRDRISYFLDCICKIDDSLSYNKNLKMKIPILKNVVSSEKIYLSKLSKICEVDIEYSVGKICAEYIWAYPPGIPIVVPGEVITEDLINCIYYYEKNNIELEYSKTKEKRKLSVIA